MYDFKGHEIPVLSDPRRVQNGAVRLQLTDSFREACSWLRGCRVSSPLAERMSSPTRVTSGGRERKVASEDTPVAANIRTLQKHTGLPAVAPVTRQHS